MIPGGDPASSVAKFIYVARNPKDVAVSLYHHSRLLTHCEFDGDWDCFFEIFMEGKNEMGSWFDHVPDWWKHRGILKGTVQYTQYHTHTHTQQLILKLTAIN